MSEEINVETSLVKVGAVGVDSGRIMLLDPCNEGKRTADAAVGSLSPAIDGVRSIRRGSVEIGIMAQTPGGDGVFPVIAEIVDGKLNGLLLDFGDDDLEKGILGARMIARGEEAPEIVGPVEPESTDEQRDQLRYVEGWQGTPPAEGTRRALILETIRRNPGALYPHAREARGLQLADAIEGALIGMEGVPIKHPTLADIERQLKGYRDEHAEAHAILDRLGVPAGPEISPPTVLNRLRYYCEPRVMAENPDREAQLLEQRESACAGEDHFKAQRDAALHLVRWLIGDLIPSQLVDLAEDDS